jgi:multiple sugar transport system ATP-binding protein
MAGVSFKDVNKSYGDVHVVKNLNLEIADKEFLVLVGPSGCGKSTTLRMLAGLEEITAGTVSIADRVINDVAPKDRNIAMVFQNYALYPHMTVYENMAFGLKLRRFGRAETEQRVKEAAQMLELTACLDRRPDQLSGGQCQRVALARALVRRPKVYLLDEPLSDLDPQTRLQMRAEIARLQARLGTTMVYVTHDQVEALTLGHRIAVMNAGILQQVAAPADLYQHPANRFVAGFIGFPPTNFFEGTLQAEGSALVFQETTPQSTPMPDGMRLTLESPANAALRSYVGQKILCGIRPEHLKCRPISPGTPTEPRWQAVVEAVRVFGSETHIQLTHGSRSIVAQVRSMGDVNVKAGLIVGIQASDPMFFDPNSGSAIS